MNAVLFYLLNWAKEGEWMNSFVNRLQLLTRFFFAPRRIGSITPSSRFLVNALLESIPWYEVKTIVELGAGTGVVTREIERRKQQDCKTVIFEIDPYLREILHKEDPDRIICSNAVQLCAELEQLKIPMVECIVSSLPFANFKERERLVLLQQIRKTLFPNQLFIAYQYSLQMKPLLQRFFQQVEVRFVPFNLPPAFVYICRK